ncbi:hypothetical protein C8T65DRAFT_666536 [Cerioporus squamosus]|nr:hypothetical protein C8T65DRAFT_666536 [Cerioporus squamosus]
MSLMDRMNAARAERERRPAAHVRKSASRRTLISSGGPAHALSRASTSFACFRAVHSRASNHSARTGYVALRIPFSSALSDIAPLLVDLLILSSARPFHCQPAHEPPRAWSSRTSSRLLRSFDTLGSSLKCRWAGSRDTFPHTRLLRLQCSSCFVSVRFCSSLPVFTRSFAPPLAHVSTSVCTSRLAWLSSLARDTPLLKRVSPSTYYHSVSSAADPQHLFSRPTPMQSSSIIARYILNRLPAYCSDLRFWLPITDLACTCNHPSVVRSQAVLW